MLFVDSQSLNIEGEIKLTAYRYRELQYGWGIVIDIECKSHKLRDFDKTTTPAGSCLSLAFSTKWQKVLPEYIESFRRGLAYITEQLCHKINEPIVIEVIELGFVLTDFQVEGLGYALAGWIIREYDIDITLPEVRYDKSLNRYIYPYSIESS